MLHRLLGIQVVGNYNMIQGLFQWSSLLLESRYIHHLQLVPSMNLNFLDIALDINSIPFFCDSLMGKYLSSSSIIINIVMILFCRVNYNLYLCFVGGCDIRNGSGKQVLL